MEKARAVIARAVMRPRDGTLDRAAGWKPWRPREAGLAAESDARAGRGAAGRCGSDTGRGEALLGTLCAAGVMRGGNGARRE
jgi:hypothetical protein